MCANHGRMQGLVDDIQAPAAATSCVKRVCEFQPTTEARGGPRRPRGGGHRSRVSRRARESWMGCGDRESHPKTSPERNRHHLSPDPMPVRPHGGLGRGARGGSKRLERSELAGRHRRRDPDPSDTARRRSGRDSYLRPHSPVAVSCGRDRDQPRDRARLQTPHAAATGQSSSRAMRSVGARATRTVDADRVSSAQCRPLSNAHSHATSHRGGAQPGDVGWPPSP